MGDPGKGGRGPRGKRANVFLYRWDRVPVPAEGEGGKGRSGFAEQSGMGVLGCVWSCHGVWVIEKDAEIRSEVGDYQQGPLTCGYKRSKKRANKGVWTPVGSR